MINHEHKFIFIHIPKTGGTSTVRSLLNNPQVYNYKLHKRYSNIMSDRLYKDYFKFSIVRNPWSRLVSLYFQKHPLFTFNFSFQDYIKVIFTQDYRLNTLIQLDGNIIHHASPYLNYWLKDSLQHLNYIGRFEFLKDSFKTISNTIKFNPLTLIYSRKGLYDKHYTEYYDDETKQIVAEKYAKDIEYFGYEFGK